LHLKIGLQGPVNKEILPPDRRKVSNVGGFGEGDTLEHINEIGVRIDSMQPTRNE
jgi:hypothetical protein